MITKIDIQKFGLFSDYSWDSAVGSNQDTDKFKKVNIIYGRNYSGKTTLSRIFRCIEKQELHKDYSEGKFSLSLEDGTTINESNINSNKKIRVYNTDFVRDNLSFLRDDENGKIEPFALLGDGNNAAERRIIEITKELGLIDTETNSYPDGTLCYKLAQKGEEQKKVSNNYERLANDLDAKLRDKANRDIKANSNYIRQGTNYTITTIKAEIEEILFQNLNCLLDEEKKENQKAIIKENVKEKISKLSHVDLELPAIQTIEEGLLFKEIKLTNTLKELIENDILQAWVKQGRDLHKERSECAFCGNPISIERCKDLEAHFSKESEELESAIRTMLKQLNDTLYKLDNFIGTSDISKDKFYANLSTEYDNIILKRNSSIKEQKDRIKRLKDALEIRSANLFKPVDSVDFTDIKEKPIDFNSIIKDFNALIDQNEDKTKSLDKDKENARRMLRYDAIKKFLNDIDYSSLLKMIEVLKCESDKLSSLYDNIKNKIKELEKEKTLLESSLKDEGKAAEKINNHLMDFFGHDGLHLAPIEKDNYGEKQTRFIIKRGEQEAKNLSEGECSLIAFCYFIAKIEDELKDPNAKENLIIYIDDPISSLDNNHIFFMFGLIDTIIVSAKNISNIRFHQLFISTHNLEFLKYLQRLSLFKGTYSKDSNENQIYFLVEKRKLKNKYKCILRLMPKHLRLNTTEYIYLFEQIYNMAAPHTTSIDEKIKDYEENYTPLYNIGNNMRKFMESFLSFKYAGENEPLPRLKEFFSEMDSSQLNRASNEYSHLSWLEKGTTLLDVPEAERLALLILKGVKKNDETHFNSLCEKIGKDPSIFLT